MGLFKKAKEAMQMATGGEQIPDGRLGMAVITSCDISGTSITIGNVEQRVCTFGLEVYLDDTDRYRATAKAKLPEWDLAKIQPGATQVAVRVDPQDPQHVAIDFSIPPPTVRAKGQGSYAELIATGTPATAIIVQFQDMGMTNAEGVPIKAFLLTVMPEGRDPYQAQVGNPVPATALPLVYPGSKVPVKLGAGPEDIAIDWAAAAS